MPNLKNVMSSRCPIEGLEFTDVAKYNTVYLLLYKNTNANWFAELLFLPWKVSDGRLRNLWIKIKLESVVPEETKKNGITRYA